MSAPADAEVAGLRYVSDEQPGIRRLAGARHTFKYESPDGSPVTDGRTLEHIDALVIPPAWTDVWIATAASAHLQPTGRDARGRKQYRYHDQWRTLRDDAKFARLAGFARALPGIRARVATDLTGPGLPREKVLAAVTRLLDLTHIRHWERRVHAVKRLVSPHDPPQAACGC